MLNLASFLEMLMLICFGLSWPINIAKAWRARSTKGISVLFYCFILLGYVVGIAAKLVLIRYYAPAPWYETVHWYVMFFYVLNTLMVAAGVAIHRHDAADLPALRDGGRHEDRDEGVPREQKKEAFCVDKRPLFIYNMSIPEKNKPRRLP